MPAANEESCPAPTPAFSADARIGGAVAAPAPGPVPAFSRWQHEAEKHWRAGDYAWMAERVPAVRVLEVGCGAGFGTLALAPRVGALLVLEPMAECIAAAAARLQESGAVPRGGEPFFLQVGSAAVDDAARRRIASFAPQWVVCWLIGADDAALDHTLPPARAVQAYRESAHRQVAELAASLPSVEAVYLVDRSAFPWKIKDTARETLVLYHEATTFAGLPFRIDRPDTLYRKLETRQWPLPASRPGQAPAGIVPVLGSLVARRVAAPPTSQP